MRAADRFLCRGGIYAARKAAAGTMNCQKPVQVASSYSGTHICVPYNDHNSAPVFRCAVILLETGMDFINKV